jgi:hypothetical protein
MCLRSSNYTLKNLIPIVIQNFYDILYENLELPEEEVLPHYNSQSKHYSSALHQFL